jgi:threonine/homoserine/homoserine lactone efflux protein
VVRTFVTFLPVAAVLTITPGAGTAMVVRSAVRGGQRHALFTVVGNSAGVLAWGCFAAIGIAAVVATSAEAFAAVKLAGAVVLVVLGLQSLRRSRSVDPSASAAAVAARDGALRAGLLTSLANPKLAVFFVALFPQFVPDGASVLGAALLMAGTIVTLDLVWYSTLAYFVARARRAFVVGPWLRRADRLTGAVLVGLGVRLALERRSYPAAAARRRCICSPRPSIADAATHWMPKTMAAKPTIPAPAVVSRNGSTSAMTPSTHRKRVSRSATMYCTVR